jgi:transposase
VRGPVALTDHGWSLVRHLITEPTRRPDGRGRPRTPPRDVLDGILHHLHTRESWARLPRSFPPYQTCHRRWQQWS